MSKRLAPLNAITDADAAYLAGLLDGEGCFSLKPIYGPKDAYTGRGYFTTEISIGMTHEATIAWLADLLGVKYRKRVQKQEWQPVYVLNVQGRRANGLARRLMPYLHTKAEQAAIFVAFDDTIVADTKGGLPLETKVIRMEMYSQMRGLNRRGVA